MPAMQVLPASEQVVPQQQGYPLEPQIPALVPLLPATAVPPDVIPPAPPLPPEVTPLLPFVVLAEVTPPAPPSPPEVTPLLPFVVLTDVVPPVPPPFPEEQLDAAAVTQRSVNPRESVAVRGFNL